MEQAKGTGKKAEITSKDAIIEVESGELQLGAVGRELPQFVDQGLDGQGKEERSQGIPLLDANFGGELVFSKLEARGLSIAPLRPTSKLGELSSDLGKSFCAVDAIESVFEVKFEKTFGGARGVGFGPIPGRVDGPISSELRGHPHLAGLEELLSVLLNRGAQALASKPAQDFANCDWSEATFGFAQSQEAGSGEVFGKLGGGSPTHKKLNDFRELLQDSSPLRWRQGFKDVLDTQA